MPEFSSASEFTTYTFPERAMWPLVVHVVTGSFSKLFGIRRYRLSESHTPAFACDRTFAESAIHTELGVNTRRCETSRRRFQLLSARNQIVRVGDELIICGQRHRVEEFRGVPTWPSYELELSFFVL